MSERTRYRLKQDGIPVAWADGLKAWDEIINYARVYSQDGPVLIEKHVGGKWKKWPPRLKAS